MKDSWLEIINLDKLVNFTRNVIYYNFDDNNNNMTDEEFVNKVKNMGNKSNEELDKVLPFEETKTIMKEFVKKRKNKKTNQIAYFMKESDYDEVLYQFNQRMISNIVSGLVSKGLLESAYDNEKNDFVFWVKKNEEED